MNSLNKESQAIAVSAMALIIAWYIAPLLAILLAGLLAVRAQNRE